MAEPRITLNCGSDELILRITNHLKYLPLPLLSTHFPLCSAALRVRNGIIQAGRWIIGNAAGVSLKLSGVAGDNWCVVEPQCFQISHKVSFEKKVIQGCKGVSGSECRTRGW